MHFCLGVHNHQPVGNFGWVFDEMNQKSYRPFFEHLSRFPRIKFSLHMSGVLLDWYKTHDVKTLKRSIGFLVHLIKHPAKVTDGLMVVNA